jgi:outer membrane protein assembly factor BamB
MLRNHTRPFLVLSLISTLVAVPSCSKKNRAPDPPDVPVGPDSCLKDTTYTFTAIAADPDDDSVAVRFDWGDTTTSDWQGWLPSGDTVNLTHAWSDTGSYEVAVQARDQEFLSSGWSGALVVRVVVPRTPPDAPPAPTGPAKGGQDSSYAFAAVAFHPDSVTVSIRLAWGDGDTSGWSPLVACGESVRMSHRWSAPDTYAVTAQAKDSGNALSVWSAPHEIVIRPPDTLRVWRFKLIALEGNAFHSSPAIGQNGTIYVGSADGCLYAVNPDGSLEWRFLTGDVVRSSPAIGADGTVHVGSYDDYLYALSPDGALGWSYATGGLIHSSPAIGAGGTVYFGSLDRWFYAFNPDGSLNWRTLAGKAARASPAVGADSTVYIGSDDGNLYALSPNGTISWEYRTGGIVNSSPAIGADGTVYCGSDDGYLYALNPDGTLKWRHGTGGYVQASPAVASDGTIYVGSYDSSFHALNSDGTLRWRYETGGSVAASPAIAADGTVHFGSFDRCLYALNPDGTLKWRYETDGAIKSSPTIGPDGTVYCTSDDGHLYALKGTSPLAGPPWPKFHHDLRNTGRVGGGR